MLLFENDQHGQKQKKLVGLASRATLEARRARGGAAAKVDAMPSSQQEEGVSEQSKAELGFISLDESVERVQIAKEEQRRP